MKRWGGRDLRDRRAAPDRSALSLYLDELRRYPQPSAEQFDRLMRDVAAGRPGAVTRLAHSALGFVVGVARGFVGLGLPFEELLNEGNLGLVQAARRFRPDLGHRFTTYAVWWIRKSILSALSRSGQVSLPHYQAKRLRRIRDAEHRLRESLGRTPNRAEVSEHLSESVDWLDRTLRHRPVAVSISQRLSGSGTPTIESVLPDGRAISPEERLLERERRAGVAEGLARLSARERFVLERRFGLHGRKAETLGEIGTQLGLSRERVRQIEQAARAHLRRLLSARRVVQRTGREGAARAGRAS